MQAGSAAQGAGTIPGRSRLNALLAAAAVLVVAAMVALLVWVGPLTTSEVRTEDAIPKAGSAVVHDDSGNLHPGVVSAIVHDDAGNIPSGAGPAVIHDDAGNLKSR